jgi:hypothetical protein
MTLSETSATENVQVTALEHGFVTPLLLLAAGILAFLAVRFFLGHDQDQR